MRLIGKKRLEKLKRKNKGNTKLCESIDELITDVESHSWRSPEEVRKTRKDADCVHSEGFYFFNISVHRTMILLEFEDDEASVVWVGSHQDYTNTFKNNKSTIARWLRSQDWIE
jgi:mRNA interferase HigB